MNCINCYAPLEEVFEGSGIKHQYKDALDIQIHLGYGEFEDQGIDQEGSPRANFCHNCATDLLIVFPGIRRMIYGEKHSNAN